MFKRFFLGALSALLLCGPAFAQSGISQKVGVCDPAYPQRCVKPNTDGSVNVSGTISASLGSFAPTGNASLSVTTSSARVAFGSVDTSMVVQNTGSATAYVKTGDVTVTAATTDTPIPAGASYAFNTGGSGYIAAITASGSTSLRITTGTGLPALALASSGGGGSGASVTATAAAPTLVEGSTNNNISANLKGGIRFFPIVPSTGAAIDLSTPSTIAGADGSTVASLANPLPIAAQSGAAAVSFIQASASAAINVSTATTTQLVALSGTTKIYVTSFDVIAGGTGNITFVYGTGAACGTGTTSLTGAYNLTAQAGIAKGNGLGPVLVVPAGNALCVTTSAAVQMSGSVAYTQF